VLQVIYKTGCEAAIILLLLFFEHPFTLAPFSFVCIRVPAAVPFPRRALARAVLDELCAIVRAARVLFRSFSVLQRETAKQTTVEVISKVLLWC
jgi:hypothetical protein